MESIATIKNVENTLSEETFQNEVRFQRSPTINFTPKYLYLQHCYYLVKEERFPKVRVRKWKIL